jgi:hypothetical protein
VWGQEEEEAADNNKEAQGQINQVKNQDNSACPLATP